jgi:hypothetical protein
MYNTCSADNTEKTKVNMELDVQNLFGLRVT